jgi:glycosyltransferase involved in cell wall biosynthesis
VSSLGGLWERPPLVSVLTPSLPERAEYLRECRLSVSGQTVAAHEHLVEVDEERRGCSVTMNRLAARATGDWVLPLADDDLLLPGCLASLLARADDGDIIYSPPLVTGNQDRWWFYQAPPVIPSFALIRRDLWNELGGYDESLRREEDRQMWIAALDLGARFVRVDEPTWVYRQHAANKSFNKVAA